MTGSFASPVNFPYGGVKSGTIPITTSYLNLFKHLDPAMCPLVGCSLLEKGCVVSYGSGNVNMAADGAVSAFQDKIAGYTTTICVRCEVDDPMLLAPYG